MQERSRLLVAGRAASIAFALGDTARETLVRGAEDAQTQTQHKKIGGSFEPP